MIFNPESKVSDSVRRLNPNLFAITNQNTPPARVAARGEAFDREKDLGDAIAAWCDAQWPRWKVIRARTDKPSTIAVGAQDLTIFAPNSRVLCLELKRKDGKLSPEQQAWSLEMHKLGHAIHVVRSMEQFLELVGVQPKLV